MKAKKVLKTVLCIACSLAMLVPSVGAQKVAAATIDSETEVVSETTDAEEDTEEALSEEETEAVEEIQSAENSERAGTVTPNGAVSEGTLSYSGTVTTGTILQFKPTSTGYYDVSFVAPKENHYSVDISDVLEIQNSTYWSYDGSSDTSDINIDYKNGVWLVANTTYNLEFTVTDSYYETASASVTFGLSKNTSTIQSITSTKAAVSVEKGSNNVYALNIEKSGYYSIWFNASAVEYYYVNFYKTNEAHTYVTESAIVSGDSSNLMRVKLDAGEYYMELNPEGTNGESYSVGAQITEITDLPVSMTATYTDDYTWSTSDFEFEITNHPIEFVLTYSDQSTETLNACTTEYGFISPYLAHYGLTLDVSALDVDDSYDLKKGTQKFDFIYMTGIKTTVSINVLTKVQYAVKNYDQLLVDHYIYNNASSGSDSSYAYYIKPSVSGYYNIFTPNSYPTTQQTWDGWSTKVYDANDDEVKFVTANNTYYGWKLMAGQTYVIYRDYNTRLTDKEFVFYLHSTASIKTVSTPSVTIANDASGIKLSWKKATNATGYIVYRSVNGSDYTKYKTVTSLSLLDKSVSAGKKYSYKVYGYYTEPYGKTTILSKASSVKTIYYVTRVSISSLKNSSSKAMTVKWGKNTKCSGYEIQYSTSSKFTSPKSVKITSKNTVSKAISKLTKGKTYYVRVRCYYKVGSTTYYSAWSASKSVKIAR